MRTKQQYRKIIENVQKDLNDFLYSTDERYINNLVEQRGRTLSEATSLAAWDWTHGIGLYGSYKLFEITKNEKYLDFIENWFLNRIELGLPEKNVNTVAPLLTLAFLYEHRPKKEYLQIMQDWAQWIMLDMPRTQEGGIQHTHAELVNNQELWDDTLMMTVLFLTKASKLFNRKDYLDEAIYQLMIHTKYLLDVKTGLWYHGWTFLERNNFAGALWGRGNCWLTVFIPEFIEIAQPDNAVKRYAIELLACQAKALKEHQADNGLWHTIINNPKSYLEASCTAGFCFGILKGIRMGYLSKDEFENCGLKALEAIQNNITDNGELLNVSYGTNVGRTIQHYLDIPLQKMHYGQSLAMLAMIEGYTQNLYEKEG